MNMKTQPPQGMPPMPSGPDYPVAPLKQDEIRVAAVQMNPEPVCKDNPTKGIKANLDHMLELCDAASVWPPDPMGVQLLVFPEFTLSGYDTAWTTRDWLKIAIHVPGGPEVEAIGQKAKTLGCYIAFSTYTQDPDNWPGHFFSNSVMVGPTGEVAHTHWKCYHGPAGILEYSTTIHDVLDEFVERYGWEAVWSVARTEFGNIGAFTCAEGFPPETARALAMNGAEILVRHMANAGPHHFYDAPGIGSSSLRMRSDCIANHTWGIFSDTQGNHIHINGKRVYENSMGGGSMLIDPFGNVIQQAHDSLEQVLHTTIPIASYRKKHKLPRIRKELFTHFWEQQLRSPVPPNLYAEGPPENIHEALEMSLGKL